MCRGDRSQELSTSKEDTAQHDWILASLSEIRWQWYRRHGLSQVRLNDGFWDFLIPGWRGAGQGIPVHHFGVCAGHRSAELLAAAQMEPTVLAADYRAGRCGGGDGVSVPICAMSDGLGARVHLRSYTKRQCGRRHSGLVGTADVLCRPRTFGRAGISA